MRRMCVPRNVNNKRSTLRNISEERMSHLHWRGGDRERVWRCFESRLLEGTVRLHVEDLNVAWEGDGCVRAACLTSGD